MAGQAEIDREARGAPAQRDAGAAMAVIMDEPFVAQGLGPDDEALRAIGAQARDGADDPPGRDVDDRQAFRAARGAGTCEPRARRSRGAGGESERGGGDQRTSGDLHGRRVGRVCPRSTWFWLGEA